MFTIIHFCLQPLDYCAIQQHCSDEMSKFYYFIAITP